MKNVFSRVAAIAALVVCAGAAQAEVIDFESVNPVSVAAPPFMLEGDLFTHGDYYFQPFSNSSAATGGDLVGAIINGATLDECFSVLCPSNNPTTFYGALNDGVVAFGRLDGQEFRVNSFDASFLGAFGASIPSTAGYLRLQGILATGGAMTQTYALGGPDGAGALSFASYATGGAFAQQKFTTVYAYGFACGSTGSCTAFNSDKGQFALDNISVTAVPEPETYALMLVGLAALGAVARRRRAV